MTGVGILDYGMGNIGSVMNAVLYLGHTPYRVRTPQELDDTWALMVPGQGAMGSAMAALRATGLGQGIRRHLNQKKPYFGICLGYQLLFDTSEEDGGTHGLGVWAGQVRAFDRAVDKVPQMGWNQVSVSDHPDPWGYMAPSSHPAYAYFAHSYYVVPHDPGLVLARTTHGLPFASAIAVDRVLGCQFHPEKSGPWGLGLIDQWIRCHET